MYGEKKLCSEVSKGQIIWGFRMKRKEMFLDVTKSVFLFWWPFWWCWYLWVLAIISVLSNMVLRYVHMFAIVEEKVVLSISFIFCGWQCLCTVLHSCMCGLGWSKSKRRKVNFATEERVSVTLLGKPSSSNAGWAVHGGRRDMWCSCVNTIPGEQILHISMLCNVLKLFFLVCRDKHFCFFLHTFCMKWMHKNGGCVYLKHFSVCSFFFLAILAEVCCCFPHCIQANAVTLPYSWSYVLLPHPSHLIIHDHVISPLIPCNLCRWHSVMKMNQEVNFWLIRSTEAVTFLLCLHACHSD